MHFVILGILGSFLYWLYWVVINFWPFLLVGAFTIWAVPKIARVVFRKWKEYQAQLGDQKKCEQGQN